MLTNKLLLLFVCLLSLVLPVAAQSKHQAKYSEAITTSQAAVRAMLERSKVPGFGVAVAVDGQIVWAEGFGYADVEKRVPVTNETKFGIGSITKSLTTALFARLVEEGAADWDVPVENYLPEFPHKNKQISVRLIAGHASGLSDEFASDNFYTAKHYATTAEALKAILTDKLQSQPRERHLYVTGTYTVIAGVVEKTAKRDFQTALRDYVLQPLNLKNIVPNNRQSIIANRTAFYVQDDKGSLLNAPYFDPSHKLAGAGYLSTAEDLTRFGAAMIKPGFLKQSSLNELFRQIETTAEGKTEFGLGWRVGVDKKGRRIIHQPGGGAGISCWLWLYPDENVVITILSNQTRAPVSGRAFEAIADAFIAAKKIN